MIVLLDLLNDFPKPVSQTLVSGLFLLQSQLETLVLLLISFFSEEDLLKQFFQSVFLPFEDLQFLLFQRVLLQELVLFVLELLHLRRERVELLKQPVVLFILFAQIFNHFGLMLIPLGELTSLVPLLSSRNLQRIQLLVEGDYLLLLLVDLQLQFLSLLVLEVPLDLLVQESFFDHIVLFSQGLVRLVK